MALSGGVGGMRGSSAEKSGSSATAKQVSTDTATTEIRQRSDSMAGRQMGKVGRPNSSLGELPHSAASSNQTAAPESPFAGLVVRQLAQKAIDRLVARG